MILNKLSRKEFWEERRDKSMALNSFKEKIEEIENEIESIKSMPLEKIQKKYWVDTMQEAIQLFEDELQEVNSKLEDFKVETYKKEEYE